MIIIIIIIIMIIIIIFLKWGRRKVLTSTTAFRIQDLGRKV